MNTTTVTLGTTTYTVEAGPDTTWLTGPKGAVYFLRGFLNTDDGLRQVISWKSGSPLRVKGNEVRVLHLGNVIEVAA